MANLKGFFLQNKSPANIYPVIARTIKNIFLVNIINNNHNSNRIVVFSTVSEHN
jgi:hypothetical protein